MKSVTLDRWTPDMVRVIEPLDNEILNAFWEKEYSGQKPTESASATVVDNFIRSKYERRSWVDRSRADPASEVINGTFNKVVQEKPDPPKMSSSPSPPLSQPEKQSVMLVDLLADEPLPSHSHLHSHSAPPVHHTHTSSADIWQTSFKLEASPLPPVTLASVQYVPEFPTPTPKPDPNALRQENIARVMSMYQTMPPQPQQTQQFQPLGAIAAQSMMQHGYAYYGGSQWPSF
eukprot:CAMPEP_0204913418 /NCGR_PEP_ID=MMETSP1397-20131031/11292_1 /ASSEMBLY_ACC=CAM_ASM_000891 /TAXON_ID=49980 /ORGANISM="Climacostomum Climacostomum virens, Strain Stock W-24" /LENGTH=231 /DNA_ID=CAMNT_0052084645 /DNA_START=152 /DNA_END=847 /DNA_ORIENTATION=+